jgi:hypothetical protein
MVESFVIVDSFDYDYTQIYLIYFVVPKVCACNINISSNHNSVKIS